MRNSGFVKFSKTTNGNLLIELLKEGREVIREAKGITNTDSDNFFIDLIEWQLCNGDWELVNPEEIGALTSSIILTDNNDNYYWFPNYQVESPVETLYQKGKVIFTLAK